MENFTGAAKHILVVDDEPLVSESVKMILALDGHKAETARSAEEALAKFNKDHYDIIVTDFAMPGMRGDELARNIKSTAPSKPVVLLTAFPPATLPPEIDVLVIKPCDVEALREGIAAASES
jgi:CheY-like chemotaxis protein